MATRQVTGTILKANGTPWRGAPVYFQLTDDAFTVSPAETIPTERIAAITDVNGGVLVYLVSGLDKNYLVTLPDGSTFEINVPAGSATTLEALRAATVGPPVTQDTIETYLLAIYGSPPVGRPAVIVQEGDVNVVTDLTTLDFDASDFNVTESPSGEANVALAYGTGAGTPAEGNHTHTGVYAPLAHTHAPSDLTLLASNSFTTASSVAVDSVFTATYRNYRILIEITGGTALGAGGTIRYQNRVGGVTASGATDYVWTYDGMAGAGAAAAQDTGDPSGVIGAFNASTTQLFLEAVVNRPQIAAVTLCMSQSVMTGTSTGYGNIQTGFSHNLATAYDGFIITPSSGNMTGKYWVHGIPGT